MTGDTNASTVAKSTLMLFSYGNTYPLTTGGWSSAGYTLDGYTAVNTIYLEDDHIRLAPDGNSSHVSMLGTVKQINITPYSTLCVTYKCTTYNSYTQMRLGFPTAKANGYNAEIAQGNSQNVVINQLKTYTWNIGSLTGMRYMMFNNHDGGGRTGGYVYEVYLTAS